MKRFEYRREHMSYGDLSSASLATFGQEGWELVALTPAADGAVRFFLVIFKRELPEG